MSMLAMFLPLAKVDADQRIVEGVATAEQPDRSGEICDYDSTKPYFEAWSAQCHEASGGRSLGAVRAMHGNVAAGKLTDINFDDSGKRILVTAKIVDDDEWNKVLEGVYTGFSQGGRYIARWQDETTGLTRYTADPVEISLVDLPCLPEATFEVVRNGVSEFRKFSHAEPAEAPVVEPAAPAPLAEAPASAAPEPEATPAAPAGPARALPIEALGKAAVALTEAANKLERAVAENQRLHKTLSGLEQSLAKVEARLTIVEAQPAPARAALRAPPKAVDGREPPSVDGVEAAIKHLAALPDHERALALTKVSLANPVSRAF
jgi:hypothetical protein